MNCGIVRASDRAGLDTRAVGIDLPFSCVVAFTCCLFLASCFGVFSELSTKWNHGSFGNVSMSVLVVLRSLCLVCWPVLFNKRVLLERCIVASIGCFKKTNSIVSQVCGISFLIQILNKKFVHTI